MEGRWSEPILKVTEENLSQDGSGEIIFAGLNNILLIFQCCGVNFAGIDLFVRVAYISNYGILDRKFLLATPRVHKLWVTVRKSIKVLVTRHLT